MSDAFDLLREETITEINAQARLYRHKKTGAEVLSLKSDDENKVFGVAFKTPPADSTGIAHILEHSVLCGSRKYPVKKPFVEMLKGSLHTFLNAMTYPDKTVYPVASQNLKDFYNLVDVYLDAVYFPLITEDIFRQEGWHYEAQGTDKPLVYKGVVFNEMKGAYSSPDAVLGRLSQRVLFPDTTYGVDSGGDPDAIPDLTYEDFKAFHARYYHPSNTRAFFYGDDDEAERLTILDAYFSQFEPIAGQPEVALQPRFNAPRRVERTYAAAPDADTAKGTMVTLNWMLDEITDPAQMLALHVLDHALVGTSAAPLRKAMMDSGLGEAITGGGLGDGTRQPTFSMGLKGVAQGDADKVEALIDDTLRRLADEGLAPEDIEAALNTMEFHLRENNTGSFPRGIALMLRSLRDWLHERDPFEPLAFEAALGRVKTALMTPGYFESLVRTHLIDNQHRVFVVLSPDATQAERDAAAETARLEAVRAGLDAEGYAAIEGVTEKLKALQDAVDAPQDLAKIPTLAIEDLPTTNKSVPIAVSTLSETRLISHDLPTSGILYLDIGMDLHVLPAELLPLVPLFSRALLQTGTASEDFVTLSQRIGRTTGGIGPQKWVSARADGEGSEAWLFLRGKATAERVGDLLEILNDVLLTARLDNRERISQMVLESKAGLEGRLAAMGNGIVNLRLRAGFSEADWAEEQMGGVSYLFFLRQLAKDIEADWQGVVERLERIRTLLVNRHAMVVSLTAEEGLQALATPMLTDFLEALPAVGVQRLDWSVPQAAPSEGLTIPSKVNFVGKGADLRQLGYKISGATSVAIRHLNTTWLWDKVRVQGGAYGGSASFDPYSGGFTFLSYRDPNLLGTLDAYDGASQFLQAPIDQTELTRSIIGVIGTFDRYMLPDAKGFTSTLRHLMGDTDEARQQRREEVLAASPKDFAALAEALAAVARQGRVVVLGSETAIKAANDERGPLLETTKVL